MIKLYLSDILNKTNLPINKIKLIRHSLKDKTTKACYENNFLDEFTSIQKHDFSKNFDYWMVFVSDKGNSAKFISLYKVNGKSHIETAIKIDNFPASYMYTGDYSKYEIEKIDALFEFENRLIINWGKSAISWHQKATNEKEILSIAENPKLKFMGYENLCLTFNELEMIISDNITYESYHIALESVYAIYLITDLSNGKQYVGSAYGVGGVLSRWAYYIKTKHGDNIGIINVLEKNSEQYQHFQFSILQILPKTITPDEVIKIESLYKRKLGSIEFGMNEN